MKAKFETTEQEDEQAYQVIEEAFSQAYTAGKYREPISKPYADELWEALLQILGIGEWPND